MAKRKKGLTPEQVAQAAAMKELLEQRAAERKEREEAHARGDAPAGGFAHGVDPRQIRSGRRGNR